MGTVGFSTKKEPAIIPEDTSWYKKYCHACSYFIREEAFDDEEHNRVAVRCVRPHGEDCLAYSPLVSAFIMREMYARTKAIIEAKEETKEEAVPIVVGATTLKRRSKIHKRRR